VLNSLERLTGETWDLRLELTPGRNGHAPVIPTAATAVSRPDANHPLVQAAIDLLGAKLLQVDDGFGQAIPVVDDVDELAPDAEEI
jgi:hypothetical protein